VLVRLPDGGFNFLAVLAALVGVDFHGGYRSIDGVLTSDHGLDVVVTQAFNDMVPPACVIVFLGVGSHCFD